MRDLNAGIRTASPVGILPTSHSSHEPGDAGESLRTQCGSREGVRARQVGSPWCHPASQPARVAAASPAGQCPWPLGAISSAGIWIHQCEMKITQSCYYLLALKIVAPAGRWRSVGYRAHGLTLQPPRTNTVLLPQARNLYKLPAKDRMGREKGLNVDKHLHK